MSFDLQPQKVTLQDMALTANKQQLLQAIIANIQATASKHDALTDDVENALNQLEQLMNQLDAADQVDIDALNQKIAAINDLLSEHEQGANIIGALGTLYTELNRREETKTFEVVVNTATGILEVDLTSFGFTSKDEYSLQAVAYGMKPVTISVDKVDNTKAKVYVTDHTQWEFNDTGIRFKDCSEDNIVVSLTVTRIPVPITVTLTETDGDVDNLGQTNAQ